MDTKTAALAAFGVITLALYPSLIDKILRKIGMVRPNFRGDNIPMSFGIFPLIWSAPFLALCYLRYPDTREKTACFCIVVYGMGLLGFIDDKWGDRSATGIKGHFKKFIDGELTTGFLKAIGGIVLAIGTCRFGLHNTWSSSILNGLIIALSANSMNLFDLRPGRASGVFIVSASIVIYVCRKFGWECIPLIFLLIPSLLLHERDSRARAMMGDTGSNSLGSALGFTIVTTGMGLQPRVLIFGLLVVLHLVAEKYSLTRIIASSPLLTRIDRLTGVRESRQSE